MQEQIARFEEGHNMGGGVIYELRCQGFRLTYNPNPIDGLPADVKKMLGALINVMRPEREYDGPETAIVVPRPAPQGELQDDKHSNYYILNGDFRADYEVLAPLGLDACLSFFHANVEHKSAWSD